LNHTISGRHTRPSESRRRRSWLGVPLGVWLIVVLGAGIALAVLISSKTATETITAQSVGQVDIGDLETEGVFLADVSQLASGTSPGITECVEAVRTDTQEGDTAKIYSGPVSGDLADDLHLRIDTVTGAPPQHGAGHVTCEAPTAYTSVIFDGTLAEFAATRGTFATGQTWPSNRDWAHFRIHIDLTGIDPQDVAGQTATMALVFENRTAS